MKIIKEYQDGFRWIDGDTSSIPFEKDSDIYKEKLAEGFELVLLSQAEKDAYAIEQANAAILAELATLDATPRLLEEAALGDEYAINKLMELKERKDALRASLK